VKLENLCLFVIFSFEPRKGPWSDSTRLGRQVSGVGIPGYAIANFIGVGLANFLAE